MRRICALITLFLCVSILYASPTFINIKWVMNQPTLRVEAVFYANNTVSIIRYNKMTDTKTEINGIWHLDTNLNILLVNQTGYKMDLSYTRLILIPYIDEDFASPMIFEKGN